MGRSASGGGGKRFAARTPGVEGIGNRTSGHGCEKGQQREEPGRSLWICKAEGQSRRGGARQTLVKDRGANGDLPDPVG